MQTLATKVLVIAIIISVALAFALMFADPAMAGPGGFVKGAAKTFWGKVVMIIVLIIAAPAIIYFAIKRRRLVKRTRAMLRAVSTHARHFEWMTLKERISDVFLWVHSAWDQNKMDLATDFMTHWYMQNQQLILDKWARDGIENITSDVQIKEITLLHLSYNPDEPDSDRVVVEVEAEMRDYMVDRNSGDVMFGDKSLGIVSTVWSFKFESGRWVLSMIESSDTASDYLDEPDVLPARAPAESV